MNDANSPISRAEALRDLVKLSRPVEEAISMLGSYPWDSEEELYVLTQSDALEVLERYLVGKISSSELRDWAEALEGRDDLGFEEVRADDLKNFLFEIATPELFSPLSPRVAADWRERLRPAE